MSDKEITVLVKLITIIACKAIYSWWSYSEYDESIIPSLMRDNIDSELTEVVDEWISIRGLYLP